MLFIPGVALRAAALPCDYNSSRHCRRCRRGAGAPGPLRGENSHRFFIPATLEAELTPGYSPPAAPRPLCWQHKPHDESLGAFALRSSSSLINAPQHFVRASFSAPQINERPQTTPESGRRRIAGGERRGVAHNPRSALAENQAAERRPIYYFGFGFGRYAAMPENPQVNTYGTVPLF